MTPLEDARARYAACALSERAATRALAYASEGYALACERLASAPAGDVGDATNARLLAEAAHERVFAAWLLAVTALDESSDAVERLESAATEGA